MPLFVGIDFGTSGCRACVIDDQGREQYSLPHPLPAPLRNGVAVEQNPAVWWQGLEQLFDVVCQHIDTSQVRAIAVDGTSSSLLLCDADGLPLTPALMYNDSRAVAAAERISKVAPSRCGAHGASSSLAKLLHLLPLNQALHALHQADWISGKLCGRFGVSDENNVLKLGYDIERRCWPDWIATLGVPMDLLPEVVTPGSVVGTLRDELAQRWGFPAATRIVSGTTDSTAGFLATGAQGLGTAVTSLGSTLVLKVLSEQPVFAPQYGVYSHRLDDLWLVGGASNSGGAVLLKHFTREQMQDLTPRLQPESPTGLDYYPLLAPGERFPVQDPHYPPRLTPVPDDPARFFQGLLEGIAAIEAQGYHLLAELGAPYPTEIRSVGGGSQNDAWTQIRAQYLGVPVTRAARQEAAYGAALLALRGGAI